MRYRKAKALDPVLASGEFWSTAASVASQQPDNPYLHWYEEHLLQLAQQLITKAFGKAGLVHVVGCGAGREVPGVRRTFPDARIIASDIAAPMVEAARESLRQWDCERGVDLVCSPARQLTSDGVPAQLVTVLNNMLTYVVPEDERTATLSALRALLQPRGVLIGVVHNQWGRPAKSGYFALQRLAHLIAPSMAIGDRIGGFGGSRAICHYFTVREVRSLLEATGFHPQQVWSLSSLARRCGRRYCSWRGDNNIVFCATAV